MKLLDQREDVVRIYVDERHDSGRFANQGMSAAAKVVASIVLTICTGGAGSLLTMVTSSLMNSMIINTVDQRGRVDRAAKTTFSKDSLKGLGTQILGQVLLSGIDMVGESLSKAAATTTQATAQTATQATAQAATKVASESAAWVDRFQKALSTSLKTNMANGVAKGIVYGKWQDQLKEAGVNFVTDTAAQFGAEQIGVGRKGEILQDLKVGEIDLYNYLSHKISHAALGAATRAVNAKLSGGDRKAVRKAAKGGAAGAASAEMVAEWMMPAALERIESQLKEQGLSHGSQAYTSQRQTLLNEELKLLRHCGEIAAVVSAQAIGGDIEAAQLAARNALTYNSAHVLTGLSIISDTATADFFDQYKQAEEDEATCVEAEAELEKALQDWKELKAEHKRLQQGRYQGESGSPATVTDDVSSLLFDVASRDKRVATSQALQGMADKVRGLIHQYENSFSHRKDLIERYQLLEAKEFNRAGVLERAKETLVRYTHPVLAEMGESSNTSLKAMAVMGAGTMVASQQTLPANMARTVASRTAAVGVGETTLGGLGSRGISRAPKDPRLLIGGVAAGGVGYGAHRIFEAYKDYQRTAADQAAAYRQDLRQGYEDLMASSGQSWMSQNAHAYATEDVPIPGLYNPRTDKGKEKLTGSEFIGNTTAVERSISTPNSDIFIKQASNSGEAKPTPQVNNTSSSSSLPPDWEPDDHEGDKWKKNDKDRWHNDKAKDKDWVPNRPNFENKELQKIADELYRPKDKYPGGSAEMLKREVINNERLKHITKCQDRLQGFKNILSAPNSNISRVDRAAAEAVMKNLREAIKMAGGK
ncbi:MAG: hypothetical protein K0M45_07445 [Candidatus Paracaedibacteraceae bacterium]|nr:hypothetical protein [Candidatus Paracaedibacteraceae bacterium]